MTSATVTAAGGSKARHDGGCRDRKIVRWESAANDRHAHPARPRPPVTPSLSPLVAVTGWSTSPPPPRSRSSTAAAVITSEVSTPFVWRCYLKPRAGNGKFVRTGMCTVFGSFSVDLTTSTSMVIHRALQVVKSVAAFGFMDLSLDSSEYCQAQHNKLDVNAY
ncbi:hypothetical protein ACI65C_002532 [Semiaphis heraclei]